MHDHGNDGIPGLHVHHHSAVLCQHAQRPAQHASVGTKALVILAWRHRPMARVDALMPTAVSHKRLL